MLISVIVSAYSLLDGIAINFMNLALGFRLLLQATFACVAEFTKDATISKACILLID